MVVAGSMIGTAIFIVPAQMARDVGSPGWLLVAWVITGVLTLTAALSYGELASMFPRAGGQYVFLREAFSPLLAFLYGWMLFAVIQTGSIAALSIGFARYAGVLWPAVAEDNYVVPPIVVAPGYAVSLSTAQALGLVLIALLTWTNGRGLTYGRWIQNGFTVAKLGALAGLILVGVLFAGQAEVIAQNLGNLWIPSSETEIAPGISVATSFGLIIALLVTQSGALFSADAWNNVTFAAHEVDRPARTVPISLAIGTALVIGLYWATNVVYLAALPMERLQTAPSDRVAEQVVDQAFPLWGGAGMAVAVMISTFGCANGLILTGARALYAMARDHLFFSRAASLNDRLVPATALWVQAAWAAALALLRTYDPVSRRYGNLYSDLLDYVISAALVFYILTVAAVFRLRRTRPHLERPYRTFGYPVVPAVYLIGASAILSALIRYRSATTWPGLALIVLGVPIYWAWRPRRNVRSDQPDLEAVPK